MLSRSFLSHELLEGEFAVVVAVPAREQNRHAFPETGNLFVHPKTLTAAPYRKMPSKKENLSHILENASSKLHVA